MWFWNQSVDKIVKGFDTMVEDLNNHANAKHDEVIMHDAAVTEASALKQDAIKERDRAWAIAEKIKGLVA